MGVSDKGCGTFCFSALPDVEQLMDTLPDRCPGLRAPQEVPAHVLFKHTSSGAAQAPSVAWLLILADANRFSAPVLTLDLVQPALTVLSNSVAQAEGAAPV